MPADDEGRVDRAVPSRHLEVESKLDVPAGFQVPTPSENAGLRTAGLAGMGDMHRTDLDATYYDTPSHDLLRSRVTLRRRTGGDDAGWHLKVPAGPSARTEVRLPLDTGESGGDGVPVQLASLVLGAARGRRLVPIARIATVRLAMPIVDATGRGLIEIADDTVTAVVLGSAGAAHESRHRWREVEVEITGGSESQLSTVVSALRAAGARPAVAASKLGRLLGQVAAGAPSEPGFPMVAKDPARTGPTETGSPTVAAHPRTADPSVSTALPAAGAVLVDFLAGQRDLLIDADIRLRAPDPDDAAAHDARAAARRIRAVLRVYSPLLAGAQTGAVMAGLRQLGAALSTLRDLDVTRSRLPSMVGDDSAAGSIRRLLEDHRAAAIDQVRSDLAADAYLGLLRDLDSLIAHTPVTTAAGLAAEDVLLPLLTAAWLDVRAHAEHTLEAAPAGAEIAAVSDSQERSLHRIRRRSKTVRYAAEAAATVACTADSASARFTATLQRWQNALGAHQDAVTTRALVDLLTTAADTVGTQRSLLDRWARAEDENRTDALRAVAALWPTLPVLPSDS